MIRVFSPPPECKFSATLRLPRRIEVHCRVGSLVSPSHRSRPPLRLLLASQSACGPSVPSAVAGARGHASLHTSHDIGTATQPHWHTPHPTPTPLRAWGAQRGDCERVCGRASRPQSRPSAAPISPAIQPHYAGPVAKLLFESQAERSRPWFAQVHASVRGLAFSIQSYANPGIRRAEVRLSMHCSQSAARRSACSAAHGGGAGGGTGRCRATLAQHASVHASPAPRSHNPSGRSGLMVEDWAWTASPY